MSMDEFHGIAGAYVADPKTGKRKLVERTAVDVPVELPKEPAPKAPVDEVKE